MQAKTEAQLGLLATQQAVSNNRQAAKPVGGQQIVNEDRNGQAVLTGNSRFAELSR